MKATALRKGTIPEPVSREVTDLDRRALDWIARAFVAGRPFDYHFTDTGLVFRVKGGRIWRSVQYIWPGGRAFEISDEEYEQLRYSEYMDAAKELKAAALDYGLPDHIAKAIEDLVAKAARENTDRATAEPRPELSPTLAERIADSRLERLQVRFEKRLREIDLPEDGFTFPSQAKAAERLWSTFRQLQEVRAELKLSAMEKPERLTKAVAMASAYRRSHDKTGAPLPVRPRGRPRRGGHEDAEATPP